MGQHLHQAHHGEFMCIREWCATRRPHQRPHTPRSSTPGQRERSESMSAAPSWSPDVPRHERKARGARGHCADWHQSPQRIRLRVEAAMNSRKGRISGCADACAGQVHERFGQRQVAAIQRAVATRMLRICAR